MYPSFLPSKFWFFISFFLFFPPNYVFANSFLSCSLRFSCGDFKDIGYPFWGLNRMESCGGAHRDFKLNCNENALEITIMSATYKVLELNTSFHTLRVARTDYSDSICPTNFINSTFENEPFQINETTRDIRVYYGCQQPTGLENLTSIRQISNEFDCKDTKNYYVTRTFTGTAIGDFFGSCTDSVIIPVPISQVRLLEENRESDALEEALRVGLRLRWSSNDTLCNSCIKRGGQCGHNTDSGEFKCYSCPEGEDCSGRSQVVKKKDANLGLRLGLGIAGAVIAILLIGIGILLVRQQRRKKMVAQIISRDLPSSTSSKGQTTSTTNTSQTNSSYHTSKYDDIENGSTYFGVHVFNYEELEEATDNFNPSKQLGEGGFGTVYYGVLKDGRVVAVKRLYENNLKRVDQYMNEIEILTLLRHPNLVKLYGCTSRRSRELLLVYEYIPNGTVADHLHGKGANSGSLTWNVRLSIALETATALTYLHKKDIIHRDVKSNNILLDKNFHVKVADFGLSRLFPTDVTHVSTAPQGTPGYVDPEYHQCYHLTEKSDVYSFGVVLVELVSAKKAVDICRHRHDINLANMAISRIQNHTLHELVDPSLGFEHDCEVKNSVTAVAELAFRCVQQERELRPSMEEVLETLREIKNVRTEAEVVDIRSDDVGLLKNIPPPLSPDYGTDKWMQIRSM